MSESAPSQREQQQLKPGTSDTTDSRLDYGGTSHVGEQVKPLGLTWKRAGAGLGVFSLVLGATELIAGRRIARAIDAEDRVGLVHGFGMREVVAGIGLLQAPANASGVWGRVGGDVMDLAALAAAARRARAIARSGERWHLSAARWCWMSLSRAGWTAPPAEPFPRSWR